jgi:hypothetical protein
MTSAEFDEFRHQSVHALMELNDQCEGEFEISKWPRWDYEIESCQLVFSEEGVSKVIATIQVVGTTSETNQNWEWSWANPNLPNLATERVREVQQFGESENISQLTEEFLPDDEFLGWAMTAVAAQVIGAKGAYRCPVDGGFVYMVYLEIRRCTEDANTPAVECETHGAGTQTFLCEHLAVQPRQKWFSDAPDESNPWPDAWCLICNEHYAKQGEWNDHNSGIIKIHLLCHQCYEARRAEATG